MDRAGTVSPALPVAGNPVTVPTAFWSMVLGIVGAFTLLLPLSVAAVYLGCIARGTAMRHPQYCRAGFPAILGISLGTISACNAMLVIMIFVAVVVGSFPGLEPLARQMFLP